MKKIKVLHLIKSLGRGGAEMLLPETLKLHRTDKFEFHYIYFLPWKDQMVEPINALGGKVFCIAASNNLKILGEYKKVIEYCEENEINLIHCHLPWSGFLGRLIHKQSEIPVIYSEHNIQERYHIATKFLNKLTFNSQSMAIGVSQDVTNSIIKNIAPEIPVKTILNGVNTSKFQRKSDLGKEIRLQYKIPENSWVIGNIAVFRKQKALANWIYAFKEIQNVTPDVFGLLVGAGPQETELKELVKNLKLEEKIIFPGLQTNTIPYFSAMDVFMMSSEFEGLPVALLEAMSMSCAIVSTKAGGVVEAVRHEEDGFLCEVGDIKGLGDYSKNLILNPSELLKFQKAARKRAVDSFSMEAMVHKLEDSYSELMNQR
ncbi:glycosyltransferase [Christiangramia salexigens]|uniref:Glycosyl transferase family 1 n=1 Tax=Christiangramia salexigens TaxID=1913577 RepID=A0A1L3J2C7_9FLAO|nr:glycosyltransferase [Christiangramia salexigens]APG59276.1 glycosyl transferase family 1 [Christiangramia salexigens]